MLSGYNCVKIKTCILSVMLVWVLDRVGLSFIEVFIECIFISIAFLQSIQEVPYAVTRQVKNEKVALTFSTFKKENQTNKK